MLDEYLFLAPEDVGGDEGADPTDTVEIPEDTVEQTEPDVQDTPTSYNIDGEDFTIDQIRENRNSGLRQSD